MDEKAENTDVEEVLQTSSDLQQKARRARERALILKETIQSLMSLTQSDIEKRREMIEHLSDDANSDTDLSSEEAKVAQNQKRG